MASGVTMILSRTCGGSSGIVSAQTPDFWDDKISVFLCLVEALDSAVKDEYGLSRATTQRNNFNDSHILHGKNSKVNLDRTYQSRG